MNSVQPGNKRISGGNPALRLIPDPSGWLVPEETSDAAVSCYYEILKQKKDKEIRVFSRGGFQRQASMFVVSY